MKKRLAKLSAIIMTFLMMVMVIGPVSAFATPTPSPDEGASGSSSVGTISSNEIKDILNTEASGAFDNAETVVRETGASAKKIVIAIAVFLLVIGLIITGVQLASRNSQKRQAAKENMVWIIVGACVVFGALAILLFAQKIADSFGSSISGGLVAVAGSFRGLIR